MTSARLEIIRTISSVISAVVSTAMLLWWVWPHIF